MRAESQLTGSIWLHRRRDRNAAVYATGESEVDRMWPAYLGRACAAAADSSANFDCSAQKRERALSWGRKHASPILTRGPSLPKQTTYFAAIH